MKNKISQIVHKRLMGALGKQKPKFTPEQQACISRNIPKKLEEGMSRDQAIAASISICAPNVEEEEKALVEHWKRKHPMKEEEEEEDD